MRAAADLLDSRNVVGGVLEPGGTESTTGFHRDGDGCYTTGADDVGRHTVCVVAAMRGGRSHIGFLGYTS